MKIGFTGVDLQEGKIKFIDENLLALELKDKPRKVTPFFVEFMKDNFIHSDVIVVPLKNILDLLILDMEKVETLLMRSTEDQDKALLLKCLDNLEKEIPLCEVEFNEEEKTMLKAVGLYSLKPVVIIDGDEDVNTIIVLSLEKADNMFFYTSGPTESHAWLVKRGSRITTCASRIHSDLERGFIKGDVVSFSDYMNCHNFNDCKTKGVAKVVNRDYIVQPAEVIEIRFNV